MPIKIKKRGMLSSHLSRPENLGGSAKRYTYLEVAMKFRVKHVENTGFFGQVKLGFFSGWNTIGKHPCGYGLYPNDHVEYPIDTQHNALERCKLYERWASRKEQKVVYYDICEI
jgi:hypothetical protein